MMCARTLTGLILLVATTGGLLVTQFASSASEKEKPAHAAPEFTHSNPQAWINSPPLKLADLRGQVVLLDFWTFDCWNCYRSFPWLKSVESQFADREFTVVGIHTPEFQHERVRANVVGKVKQFMLDHAVMMDNDYSYWKAMGNRYWPTFYLIDKQGRVRAMYIGETHVGERRAKAIEAQITQLLAEQPS